MRVVCVSNGEMDGAMESKVNLTVGKVYKVLGDRVSSTDAVFSIINDIGKQGNYYHGRFEMLEESRERKLKKILDEHS
jgi:hypothetical protein